MKKSGEFDPTAYKNKYATENYDRFSLMMPKGMKAVIKEKAAAAGESLNEYINISIRARMDLEREE